MALINKTDPEYKKKQAFFLIVGSIIVLAVSFSLFASIKQDRL